MPPRLNYLARPKLKRPVMVAGLPGIANIGKLAAEYLVHKLKAVKFAELYSEHFPEWAIQEGGAVRMLKADFFYARPRGVKHDIILATADAQAASPAGQYALTGEILDLAERHGADTVATMAAYVLSPEETRRGVVGAASDPTTTKLLEEHGVELLAGGMIVGMNGLLPGLAAARGMHGFCLLGTTRGGLLDVRASEAVLHALSSVFGFDIDLRELHQHAVALKFKPPSFKLPEGIEEEPTYIR
ncbi:MAG: PAC2 family protein [Hadesarchaea archaeon]|nr:PAC2 family protein [Hadesarchaea archaeon]